jgi:hypothetical protein
MITEIENHRRGDIFSPRKKKANNATITNTRLPSGDKTLISNLDIAPNQKTVETKYKINPNTIILFDIMLRILALSKIFVGSWIPFICIIPDLMDI